MIFIDWLVAAAVRLHYELEAQVRAPGLTSQPIKWSATNGPVLRVWLGELFDNRLPSPVRLTESFIVSPHAVSLQMRFFAPLPACV